jgi:Na+-translocating ferredoxin:NAD+ oxidoreductase subunit G
MKKILKLTAILFLISAIVAGVLGVVYELTVDKITAITQEKTDAAYAEVLAGEYKEVEYTGDDTAINKISEAYGEDGSLIGYVVETTVTGSQGSITIIIGVDTDYKCTGISITESSETSGLGAVASSSSEKGEAFRAQFVGQGSDVALAKKGGSIEALTGATITSNAVTGAVASATAACESLG